MPSLSSPEPVTTAATDTVTLLALTLEPTLWANTPWPAAPVMRPPVERTETWPVPLLWAWIPRPAPLTLPPDSTTISTFTPAASSLTAWIPSFVPPEPETAPRTLTSVDPPFVFFAWMPWPSAPVTVPAPIVRSPVPLLVAWMPWALPETVNGSRTPPSSGPTDTLRVVPGSKFIALMPSPPTPLPVTLPVATMLTRPPPLTLCANMPWLPAPKPVTVPAVTLTPLDALVDSPVFLA